MKNLIFNDLNVSDEILKAIEKMGFTEATPVQSQSIPEILAGNDVVAQAPTGTGKTCAFGIPMINDIDTDDESVQSLILCPTRELVMQTAEELQNVAIYTRGVRIVPIYGGQQIERQIMSLKRRPQIIVATPGRLMDHIRRRTIKLDRLKMIVLDEADEMLNMGFREDIDVIIESVPEERQTVLFSATLSKDILEIANQYQKDAVMIKITQKQITVPTIQQYYLEVKQKNRVDVLTRLIDINSFKLSLIFCNTKRRVDELTSELLSRGYAVDALHGDMKQMQRDRVMKRFKKGIVNILVATDVAARGIDIENIEAVFNFDIPLDEEYYVHRIGRTGRASRTGVSYTFVMGKEMYKLRDIMHYTNAKIKLMQPPSMLDVESKRVTGVLESVVDILDNSSVKSYVGHIERILENSENSYTAMDIAAGLLKVSIEGIPSSKSVDDTVAEVNPKNESESTGAELGMVRLFLSIGTLDKIRTRHVSELMSRAGVEGSELGKIDIYDKFSFAEVSWDAADRVIAELDGTSFKGRRLAVEKANSREKRAAKRRKQ